MSCEVHPKLIERWVDIYFEKAAKEGADQAKLWYTGFVPDNCKAVVLFRIRKRSKST